MTGPDQDHDPAGLPPGLCDLFWAFIRGELSYDAYCEQAAQLVADAEEGG